jgi:hypothetical protein
MSVFSLVWCFFNRHDPVRRDVAWNGLTYSGTCRHCGAEIHRLGHRDWRKIKSSTNQNGNAQI